MLVSTHYKDGSSTTVIRGGHKCQAYRNGSFIQIWYEKNGKSEWIRILPEDMREMLEKLPDYKAKNIVEINMEYDEEYTHEMAERDMIEVFGRKITDEEIQSAIAIAMKNFTNGDTE